MSQDRLELILIGVFPYNANFDYLRTVLPNKIGNISLPISLNVILLGTHYICLVEKKEK